MPVGGRIVARLAGPAFGVLTPTVTGFCAGAHRLSQRPQACGLRAGAGDAAPTSAAQ